MRRPSRLKRVAVGWVFLNVMLAGLAPAFLFLAPGRVRWAWEFTPILLGITAFIIMLLVYVNNRDRKKERSKIS